MHWRIFFVGLFLVHIVLAKQPSVPSFTNAKEANEKFALELSATAGLSASSENVLVSPLLIQAALTLLYYGASGDTASLLRSTLHLQQYANKQEASVNMASFLGSTTAIAAADAKWASALYAQEHVMFKFKPEFEQMAQQFHMPSKVIDFDEKALTDINYWFLLHTNFSTGEMLNAHVREEDSPFVLASAFVFHAPWQLGFDVKETEKLNFHSNGKQHKMVDSMFCTHKFQYAELPELQAKAVEIPFKNEHLKMLIVLPDSIEGLRALEEKIKYQNLSALVGQLNEEKVALSMPKFQVSYNGELKGALGFLGLGNIFSDNADFSEMFSAFLRVRKQHVTSVQHKAVLTVDEVGGPNDSWFSLGGLFHRPIQFVIDHPFYFAIRTDEAILLAGHIVNI